MRLVMAGWWAAVVLTLLCTPLEMRAQAAAEYGSIASKATAAGTRARAPSPGIVFPGTKPSAAAPKAASGSSRSTEPLTLPMGPSAATLNCRALKERAGSEAAKLSVRSVPDRSQVWVDGLFVGTTPMELELAPGAHQVEVDGTGMKIHRQTIELNPKQSQELVVQLESRYQTKIVLR